VRKICLGIIFICSICGGFMQPSSGNQPYARGTYQTTQQTTPGEPAHGNERFQTGAEGTVIDVVGTSVTSSATGFGGSVTFDPAKLIRKDWPDRS